MAEQYEKSRAEASTPAMVAAQELFFTGSGRAKRGPPSPEMSGVSTPLGTDATMQTATQQAIPQQPLVQPMILEDHTADQATASGFGVNINDQGAMKEFLNQPVHTAGDVLKLVKTYHKAVIRPEMFGMVAQLETAIKKVHDHTFTCQKELQFMIADNRSSQKHAAGLQLVTTGWPNGLTPQQQRVHAWVDVGKHTGDSHLSPGSWSVGAELRPHRPLPQRLRKFLVQRVVY